MRKILLVCMAVFIIAISGCENASFFRDRIKEDQITTLNTIWIPFMEMC